MAQKAEHHYDRDFYDTYNRSANSNKWVWVALTALAALALIVWVATTGDVSVGSAPAANSSAPAEQTAPAPDANAAQPAPPATNQ